MAYYGWAKYVPVAQRKQNAAKHIQTLKEGGLFPKPREISMSCSCPDHASMCKHIAAVLYGIGASIDAKPEWLFTLRNVDHVDLIASVSTSETLMQSQGTDSAIDDAELSTLFGIEMDADNTDAPPPKKAAPKPKASPKPKVPT